MKIMKKALALFIALIMVLGVVPTYAANNGVTFDLSAIFSSDDLGESPITEAKSGDTFYMNVNFANNPTATPITICAYTLLIDYDPAKVSVTSSWEMDAASLLNNEYSVEGTLLATWGGATGILSKGKILAEGTFFTVEFTALQDLTEDDLAKIKPLAEIDSVDKGGNTAQAITEFFDQGGVDTFSYTWSANVEETPLPEPITIQASDFTVSLADQTWTGTAIEPAVSSTKIPAEVYTVSYGANTDLGKGTITISLNNPDGDGFVWVGDQRYTGEDIVLEFNIVEKAIKEADFDWSNVVNTTYTGAAINPEVTSDTLPDSAFEVTYGNNTTVAEGGTVTVTAISPYSGSFTKTFKILAKAITEADFDFSDINPDGYDFEGSAIEPEVTSATLVEDQDYTVTYSNNSMAGATGKITVKGINNYTGTITKEFQINAEQLAADGEITLGYAFTSIEDGATSYDPEARISEVASGEKFVIWVNVGNNGTTSLDDTIAAYDLLLQYDNAAITLNTNADAATNPEVNLAFNANTVMASWANNKGITQGMPAKLQKEATLFVIEATANKDLNAEALLKVIDWVETATNTAGDNTQATSFVRRDRSPYNIVDGELAVVEITNSHVVIDAVTDYVYTGSEIIPNITLNNIDESEFDIVYADNVNVGEATATVTGKGKFYGSFEVKFNIVPKEITEEDFELAETKIVYTGSEIKPAVISDLVEGTDFDVVYGNNIHITTEGNEATATITGKVNYTGEVVLKFEIVSKELKDSYFTIKPSVEYKDGEAITIDSEADLFTADGLALGTDYTVAYHNNTNVGTATLVFTGIGDYEGTVTKTFEITARTLVDADFTIDPASYEYTGSEIIPTVSTTLTVGKDYTVVYKDNTNAGTATATFTGIGNYTGKVEKEFTITAKPISESDFDLTTIVDATYTGLPIEPIINSDTLIEGQDYEVTYSDNVDAGTATVTITGKGNYDIKIEKTFEIAPKAITEADFALAETEVVYKGSAIEPNVVSMLVKGTDFDVVYTDNVDVTDAAKATITGKKNYTGEVELTFAIVAKAITEADFELDLSNQTYDGTAKTVGITTVLAEGTDYEVTYLNNENAGTATVAISGKGNYTGSIVKTFVIDPAVIQESDFTFADPDDWYEAKKQAADLAAGIKPEVTSTLLDGDYEVIYTNNNAAGTATITVRGTGNYTGTVTKTFEINTYRLGDVDNDATWSTIDAVRILKMATDLYTNPTDLEKKAAEVVVDAKYNAMDALEVLKYSALLDGTISQYYGEVFSN